MSKPIHTPGPVILGDDGAEIYSVSKHLSVALVLQHEDGAANARLLAAAYNAFDSAARVLGCNAIELAEAMQDGSLLAEVLDNADAILNHTPHLDKEAFGKVEAVPAKVKGGAS